MVSLAMTTWAWVLGGMSRCLRHLAAWLLLTLMLPLMLLFYLGLFIWMLWRCLFTWKRCR